MKDELSNMVVGHVKVMRSHDYCHFEIQLPIFGDQVAGGFPESVNEVRVEAAKLCDRAVRDYQKAKGVESLRMMTKMSVDYMREEAAAAASKPEGERTPEEKAKVKRWNDYLYHAERGFEYDYEDDQNEN